jgi:hypothetical protein
VEALRIADAFRAGVVDTGISSVIFEITGKPDKVDQFIALMVPLGLVEVARSGPARGPWRGADVWSGIFLRNRTVSAVQLGAKG